MAMEKKNRKDVSEEQIKIEKEKAQERERRAILMKANDVKEETFTVDISGELLVKKELENIDIDAIDNPEEKYELYYKVVNKLLRRYLPRGEKYKEARDIIYEEKNTFLTRGHRKNKGIRGADGRMSYITDINELIKIIMEWISAKGTPFELYTKLRDLNISKGYGKKSR